MQERVRTARQHKHCARYPHELTMIGLHWCNGRLHRDCAGINAMVSFSCCAFLAKRFLMLRSCRHWSMMLLRWQVGLMLALPVLSC